MSIHCVHELYCHCTCHQYSAPCSQSCCCFLLWPSYTAELIHEVPSVVLKREETCSLSGCPPPLTHTHTPVAAVKSVATHNFFLASVLLHQQGTSWSLGSGSSMFLLCQSNSQISPFKVCAKKLNVVQFFNCVTKKFFLDTEMKFRRRHVALNCSSRSRVVRFWS